MIRNVAHAQRNILIVILVLAVVDMGALAFWLSPAVRSHEQVQKQYAQLQAELALKRVQAIPALDMDKKLVEARLQIADFFDKDLPGHYSEISEALAKAASESHVELANIRYDAKPSLTPNAKPGTGDPRLAVVNLSLDLGGNYDADIRFINALERSRMLLVIQNVNLVESQGGAIRLTLRLQTFLKAA